MLDVFRSLVGRSTKRSVAECRRCGEPVEDDTDSCPVCGWDGIARYEIE